MLHIRRGQTGEARWRTAREGGHPKCYKVVSLCG